MIVLSKKHVVNTNIEILHAQRNVLCNAGVIYTCPRLKFVQYIIIAYVFNAKQQ